MSAIRAWTSAAGAIAQRDALVYTSYRTRFASQTLSLMVTLTIFHYIARLVKVPTFQTRGSYFAFVVVGLVMLLVVQSTLQAPALLRAELLTGNFERIVLSPLGVVAAVPAMLIFPFAVSFASAAIALAFAALVLDMPVVWSTVPLAIPVAFLGTLAFASIGLFFTALLLLTKQTHGMSFVMAGLTLLAGLYFPVALLPSWIRWASDVQPLTPSVTLLRHLIAGSPLHHGAWLDIAKLAGFSVVLLPLALAGVAAATSVAQRRGTIIEY